MTAKGGSFVRECVAAAMADDNPRNREKKKYGVKLDEMKKLADIEDYFDCSPDKGPNPAIDENLEGEVQVYTTLALPEMDLMINRMAYNMFMPGYTIIIYGPRRSGKSHFIKNLCQRIRPWYPNVVCFTKTKASCEYHSYLPDTCIIEGLDEELLLRLMKDQENKKIAESNGFDQGNYNLLVILDDCMAEKLRYRDIFNAVFYNGRHYNITLIVAVQDVKGIAPAATINCDVVVTFCLPDRRGRDTLREKFADYLTRNQFDAMMDSELINKKYHMLAFDIAHRYNPIDKRIYFGSCDPAAAEDFVMGNRAMWEYDMEQLKELGHHDLLQKRDWGILTGNKED